MVQPRDTTHNKSRLRHRDYGELAVWITLRTLPLNKNTRRTDPRTVLGGV